MVTGLDIAIIVSGGVATYLGWRLGMIRVGVALVGVAAGIVLGMCNAPNVAPHVAQLVGEGKLAEGIAFMAVFLGVFAASVFLGAVIQRLLGLVFLGWLDSTAGTMRREAPMLLDAAPEIIKRYTVDRFQDLSVRHGH